MALVFADTGYWIAVSLPGDQMHDGSPSRSP